MNKCIKELLEQSPELESIYNNIKNKSQEDALNILDGLMNKSETKFKNRAYRLQKQTDAFKGVVVDGEIVKTQKQAKKNINDMIYSGKKDNVESAKKVYISEMIQPMAKSIDNWTKRYAGFKTPTKLNDGLMTKVMNPKVKSTMDGVDDTYKTMEESLEAMQKIGDEFDIPVITNLRDLTNLNDKIARTFSPDEFVQYMLPKVTATPEQLKDMYAKAEGGDEIFEGLKWKSEIALKAYTDKFSGNPVSNLLSYADKLSGQVAGKRIFGENPKDKLRQISRQAGMDDTEIGRVIRGYEEATGSVTQAKPQGLEKGFVATADAAKSATTAALMGGSVILTILDNAFLRKVSNEIASSSNMNASFEAIKLMGKQGKLREAQQMPGQFESVIAHMNQTVSKYDSHAGPSETLNKLATGVLSGTGLLRMSESMILASKNKTMAVLADNVTKTYKNIDPNTLKTLKEYGITEADWKIIRKTPRTKNNLFLDVEKVDDRVRYKVKRLAEELGRESVMQSGAKARNILSFGSKKGSGWGAAAGLSTQFLSTMLEQTLRLQKNTMSKEGAKNIVLYASEMAVSLIVLGMTANMLIEVVKGNTPENPLDNPMKSILAGVIKGGGGIILGDSLMNFIDPKFYHKDPVEAALDLLNPAAGGGIRKVIGGVKDAIMADTEEKTDRAIRKAYGGLIGMIPGQNVIYFKALVQEYMGHSVKMRIAPAAERKEQRRLAKERKENGQINVFRP